MKFEQSFEVIGTMQFPIDMLRYDGCFPASEQDSSKIVHATYGTPHSWRVKLSRYTESKNDLPTVARWQSFSADVDLRSLVTRRLP